MKGRKQKQRKEEAEQDLIPGGELKERRGSCTQGCPFTSGEIRWDRRGTSHPEESAATGLWQAGQSETYRDGLCHSPVQPSLRCMSAGVDGVWVLECGTWRADLGRGLLLPSRRQPERMGVGSSTTGNALGEAQKALEEKCHCWVMRKGWGCQCTLSPHVPAPASAGTKRGSRQIGFVHVSKSP